MSKQYKNQKAKWIEHGKVQEQERILKLIDDEDLWQKIAKRFENKVLDFQQATKGKELK